MRVTSGVRTATRCGAVLILLTLGCAPSIQKIGEEATEGALEGVREQAEDDQMPAVQETAESVGRGAVVGSLDTLTSEEQLAELRRLTHALVSQALRSALGGGAPALGGAAPGAAAGGTGGSGAQPGQGPGQLTGAAVGLSPSSPAARLSAQMGAAFSAALMAELARQLGPDAEGPLADSLAATARRVASESVDGAASGIQANAQQLLPECEGAEDVSACLEAKLTELSRSASVGAVQGIQEAFRPWGLVIAFGAGLLFGLLLMLLVLLVRVNRRLVQERAPLGRRREPSHAR